VGERDLVIVLAYTGCPRRNVPDFGRVVLMLKYNDITQNTHSQSRAVTEIMAREKCGLLAVPRTVPVT
jgi:aspartate 1-decarboxylase